MCEATTLSKIIYIAYWLICFLVPIGYLIMFKNYKSKKKNYIKACIIALGMFAILFSVKLVVNLDIGIFNCLNCYINNKCAYIIDDKGVDNIENNTTTNTTSTTITTTSTTTKRITSITTTTKKIDGKSYAKIKEPSGEKVEVGKTSKGYTIYEINDVTYIDGYLIANKTYALPESFVPIDTYKSAVGVNKQCATCINNTAYKAWKDMAADATAVGLNIWIQSGYRPYSTQKNIYNGYVNRDGVEKADTYSARPGHSEHQSGECFDLNSITDAFANTAEGKWVAENCYKYGYIIRYPKGKQDITGYKYESWHLRYVGTDLSYKLYNDGNWITMEEYFGITSVYQN